jgi:hypothetical protein
MDKENGQSQAVAVRPQMEMFGGLFKVDAPEMRVKTTKSGLTRIGLMPMRSKTGVSLASLSGFKGAALEAHRSKLQDDMKGRLGGVAGVIGASPDWTGSHISLNGKGDRLNICFVKRHGSVTKDGVLATLSEDELMAELDKRAGVVAKPEAVEA